MDCHVRLPNSCRTLPNSGHFGGFLLVIYSKKKITGNLSCLLSEIFLFSNLPFPLIFFLIKSWRNLKKNVVFKKKKYFLKYSENNKVYLEEKFCCESFFWFL